MRNGSHNQLNTNITRLMIVVAGFLGRSTWAGDSKIEVPLPTTLTRYFQANPESNLELMIQMDRMESKQDEALTDLFRKTRELPEGKSLSAATYTELESKFLNELNEKIKAFDNPYIEIEGHRLYADFLLRLALAAMPDKTHANEIMKRAENFVSQVHDELHKRGSEWVEKETPQILSRLATTELSLLNIKRLVTGMGKNDFLSLSAKITDAILDIKPRPVSELEILTAHLESLLYAQKANALEPRSHMYMAPAHQKRFKEIVVRVEGLTANLADKKYGGIRRLLAIEKAKTVSKIANLYIGSPSDFMEAFRQLSESAQSENPMEKRTAMDALQYLYSVNELTGLTLPAAKLIGKEAEAMAAINNFETDFKKNMGAEFYARSMWPSFAQVFSTLDPTTNAQASYTSWALEQYVTRIYELSTTFLQYKKDAKSVSNDRLQEVLENSDRAWAYLQCGFVFNGIDRFNGNLQVSSPLTRTKFNLGLCQSEGAANQFISNLAYKMQSTQIQRSRNLELTLTTVGLTVDIALVFATMGAASATTGLLRQASQGAFRAITKKLAAQAAGRVALRISQKIATTMVIDLILSTSKGLRSFTFEACRGRLDVDNLKDMPYFDKDIGLAKHMVRLVATSMAGFGMDHLWRVSTSYGLRHLVEPDHMAAKMLSSYTTKLVNTTVEKLTSAVADLPFEGRAALAKLSTSFTMKELLLGNLQAMADGHLKKAATSFDGAGLSPKFMIRISDRQLNASETAALQSALGLP